MDAEQDEPALRDPSLAEALLPPLSAVVLLGVGYGYLGLRVEALLLLSTLIASLVARRMGADWARLERAIVAKISEALPAMLILVAVGFMIGAWMVAGTVPLLIHLGLRVIDPRFVVVTAFVFTAIVSTVTGTSWGAIGTAGVALIGVAEGLGAPLPATAGAIVSGAYFGDKLSPLSDTTNLAPLAAGTNLYAHIRQLLYTSVPATLVALVVYLVAGLGRTQSQADLASVDAMIAALERSCELHWLLGLPAVVVFLAAVRRSPPVPTMLLGGALALVLAFALDPDPARLGPALEAVVGGPKIDTGHAALDSLLARGGMMRMTGPILLVLCAYAFAGVLGEIGCLRVLSTRLLEAVKDSRPGLMLSTSASTLAVALVTGDAYLAILLPGELFREAYPARGLEPKNLSRILEDSGTVVMPLIPWAVSCAYVSESLGVSVFDYGPWAVFCYLGLALSVLYAVTGIAVAPLPQPPKGRSVPSTD